MENEQANKRKVSTIAKRTSIAPRYGKLLFRFVNYFQPNNILELGTSLGISTLYQAAGNLNASVTTIEGCPNIAKIAESNFEALNIENISLHVGNFDECLSVILKDFEKLDYVFIDGNHQMEATLRYFELILEKVHDGSIFVFDDIHWSSDMSNAWKSIINNKQVSLSLDFYQLGVIFFRKGQAKEHFKLWY